MKKYPDFCGRNRHFREIAAPAAAPIIKRYGYAQVRLGLLRGSLRRQGGFLARRRKFPEKYWNFSQDSGMDMADMEKRHKISEGIRGGTPVLFGWIPRCFCAAFARSLVPFVVTLLSMAKEALEPFPERSKRVARFRPATAAHPAFFAACLMRPYSAFIRPAKSGGGNLRLSALCKI